MRPGVTHYGQSMTRHMCPPMYYVMDLWSVMRRAKHVTQIDDLINHYTGHSYKNLL